MYRYIDIPVPWMVWACIPAIVFACVCLGFKFHQNSIIPTLPAPKNIRKIPQGGPKNQLTTIGMTRIAHMVYFLFGCREIVATIHMIGYLVMTTSHSAKWAFFLDYGLHTLDIQTPAEKVFGPRKYA